MVQSLRDDMRSLQDAASISDRRTIETLQAVQDTLKTIVGRLSALESEVETVTEPVAARAMPAAAASPVAETPLDLADHDETFAVPSDIPHDEADDVVGRRRSDRQAPKMAAGTGEAPSVDWPEDTRPLEPGSGKPRMSMKPASEGDSAGQADDPKASFIAAARRAAQVAASEMAEEDDGQKSGKWSAIRNRLAPKSSKKPPMEAEKSAKKTKRAEKAVEAPKADERPVQVPANDGGGRFGGLGQAVGDKRRMIIITLAIIALAFGVIQIFSPVEDDGTVEVAETSAPTETIDSGSQMPAAMPDGQAQDAAKDATERSDDGATEPDARAADDADAPNGTDAPQDRTGLESGGQDRPTNLVSTDDGTASTMPAATQTAETQAASETQPAETFDPPAGQLQAAPMPPEEVGSLRLRTAASRGNPSAQFEVAVRYTDGTGVPQDLKAASEWYGRAAAQGLAVAQYRLGSLYEKGQGVGKDLSIAQSWYAKAAEQGNVKAMHNIAVIYAEGAEGTPDLNSAVRWFRAAGDYGLKDSQYNLGILYA
ncbi:MAG: sel1 repeat family protein, partial [Hyphomicrobiales bacterium]|nr:sel1 repeat family protein [Hyphomicrobiales bacterium]